VFVALDHDGGLRIERGFVRPEDAPQQRSRKNGKAAQESDGPAPLADRLVAELSAHRTAALRDSLAERPHFALIATVHALAAATFYPDVSVSCLELRERSVSLSSQAPDIEATRAAQKIEARHAAWQKRLPPDPAELWACVGALTDAERLELLAHCVALTANAMQGKTGVPEATLAHAAQLASETALDMAAYWQPTAANYFSRVSKERILEAVRETSGDDAAKRIANEKKSAMAAAAEQLLTGKSWLPSLFRSQV
jgi:ParB family chromosome partitioning protein